MSGKALHRGKRINNGEWVYGYLIGDDVIVGNIVEFNDEYLNTEFWCKVDPETVGQYTGLKDKNGKEIYEGDAFKTSLGWVAVVEWEKEGRFLGFTMENERKIVYINREPRIEVIGNIHDTPELIRPKAIVPTEQPSEAEAV